MIGASSRRARRMTCGVPHSHRDARVVLAADGRIPLASDHGRAVPLATVIFSRSNGRGRTLRRA